MLNKYSFAQEEKLLILYRMPEIEEYPFNPALRETEEPSSLEDDHSVLPPPNIVAYNELRSCSDLLRMVTKKQLVINPDYQRGLVWKPAEQTRFIDSLIKQLPIPSMCFSFDNVTEKRTVIDGLQRISTVISFLNDKDFLLSNLKDIDKRIAGKTVKEIKKENKPIWERVENLSIPVTVIRCNYDDPTHMDYLFTIFHRLNSGGAKLNNQEIRNCIYNGKLNTLIKDLAAESAYKELFNIKGDVTYRFAFEELNLRFFAFSDRLNKYNGRLANFLNTYMFDKEKNKKTEHITAEEVAAKKDLFNRVINVAKTKLFNKTNRLSTEKISKTIIEAILIGIGKNIDYIETLNSKELYTLYRELRDNHLFSVNSLKEGLSQTSRVQERLKTAIDIFSEK